MENSILFKLVLVLFAAIICSGKDIGKESKDPMVKALQSLEPEEKTDFISYFLALGLKDWAENQPRPPKFLTLKRPGSICSCALLPLPKNAAGTYFISGFYLPKILINNHDISPHQDPEMRSHVEFSAKMNIPKESRKKLLEWTKSEFNLTTTNVFELFRNKNCSRSTCLPDIGELCCPW